jgi:hypothetical protein
MSNINFEEGYLPKLENSPTDLVCWRAREILGAYMLEGIDVAIETIPDAAPEEEYDDYTEFDDDAILHETTYVEINDGQRLNISNRPFIEDRFGKLHAYTWPGYIAIHIENKDAPPTYSPPDKNECDQIIFRLPHADSEEDAAIFRGFDMNEESRIDNYAIELVAVIELLETVRSLYLEIITSEEGYWQSTYLSQTPEDIEFALSQQFPEDETS